MMITADEVRRRGIEPDAVILFLEEWRVRIAERLKTLNDEMKLLSALNPESDLTAQEFLDGCKAVVANPSVLDSWMAAEAREKETALRGPEVVALAPDAPAPEASGFISDEAWSQ